MNKKAYKLLYNSIKQPIAIIQNKYLLEANKPILSLFKVCSCEELSINNNFNSIINEFNSKNVNKIFRTISNNSMFEITKDIINENNYALKFNSTYELTEKEKKVISLYNQEMFSDSVDGIAILKPDKTIITVNNAFLNIFNYEYNELIGKDINNIVVPDKKTNEMIKVFKPYDYYSKNRITIKTKRITKNSELIDVEITRHSIIINNEVHGYYIIYKDISEEIELKQHLLEKEQFSNQLFKNSLLSIAILDTNENVIDINPRFNKLFKYTKKEAISKNILDLVVPKEYTNESNIFKDSMLNKRIKTCRTKRKDKFGKLIDVETSGNPIIVNNKVIGLFAMYRDISEEINALEKLEKQQAYFKELFFKSPDAIALLNTENEIININTKFEEYFKYSIDEILGKDIDNLIVPKNLTKTARSYTDYIANEKKHLNVDAIRQDKYGKELNIEINAYPITLNNNNIGIYAIYKDISDRLEKENKIKNLIYKDNLTGAYNRRKFMNIVELEIDRYNRYNIPFSIIIFDIDKFKKINDTFGHLIGDEILKQIIFLIKNNIRENDYLIRWGGDEFIILLPHTPLNYSNVFKRKIENIIANEQFIKNISVSISCGTAEYKDSLDSLISKADKEMYNEKK